MGMNSLFQLDAVSLDRTDESGRVLHVLTNAHIGIPDTGISCLVGPSGSGKSTILRLITRLEDPTRGIIRFKGEDVQHLDPLTLRRHVALIGQHPVMLPGTVQENLAAGLRVRGAALAKPEVWLERVGLPDSFLQRSAADLSGGEKQRVALARALAINPQVLLLDEVTSALDPDAGAGVEQLITTLGLPAVWVSHDPAQVQRVADRVYRLAGGRLRLEVAQ